MSLTGELHDPPQRLGVSLVDLTCGLFAVQGVLAALVHRNRVMEERKQGDVPEDTVGGQHVDMSLYDAGTWLASVHAQSASFGKAPIRTGSGHPNIVPYRRYPYTDKDGIVRYVILAVGNDSQFKSVCEVFGLDDVGADSRFQSNADRVAHRDEVNAAMEAGLQKAYDNSPDGIEGVQRDLVAHRVPFSLVRDVGQVVGDSFTNERAIMERVPIYHDEPDALQVNMMGTPFSHMSATPGYRPSETRFPSVVGEDGRDVLASMKFSEAEMDKLFASGAVQGDGPLPA